MAVRAATRPSLPPELPGLPVAANAGRGSAGKTSVMDVRAKVSLEYAGWEDEVAAVAAVFAEAGIEC